MKSHPKQGQKSQKELLHRPDLYAALHGDDAAYRTVRDRALKDVGSTHAGDLSHEDREDIVSGGIEEQLVAAHATPEDASKAFRKSVEKHKKRIKRHSARHAHGDHHLEGHAHDTVADVHDVEHLVAVAEAAAHHTIVAARMLSAHEHDLIVEAVLAHDCHHQHQLDPEHVWPSATAREKARTRALLHWFDAMDTLLHDELAHGRGDELVLRDVLAHLHHGTLRRLLRAIPELRAEVDAMYGREAEVVDEKHSDRSE